MIMRQMCTLSVYHSAVNNSRHGATTLSIDSQGYSLRQKHKPLDIHERHTHIVQTNDMQSYTNNRN